VRRGLLLSAAVGLTLSVPAAEPAARPVRFLLAVTGGGTVSLYGSSDGVRFTASPGFTPGPGSSPSPVRRGPTLYLYGSPMLSAQGFGGALRRFTGRADGRLAESPAAAYAVQLTSPEDAARATPNELAPSLAVDDAGSVVLLYALRYEPATNACPVAGQACVKLRTATEVAGSDGTAFTGDPGNRIVVSVDPTDSIGPPSLLRADRSWAVLMQGPNGCLHALTATDPHGAYRNAGCISDGGPAVPSGLWDARLREYRLYGVAAGRVVRAAIARLRPLAPARFRPLAGLPGRPSAARVVAYAP
jgi:hypothetical protein